MRAGDTISDKTGQSLGQAMEEGKMADAGRMPAATTDTPAAPVPLSRMPHRLSCTHTFQWPGFWR